MLGAGLLERTVLQRNVIPFGREWYAAEQKFLFNTFQTTLSTGGSTAPAQGTVETWTVADSLPGSPPSTPFYFTADPFGSPLKEICEVTAVSGVGNKSWTVVRGQSGTTTHTHVPGTSKILTTLSLGVGYLGSDNNVSVDLGGTRVAWLFNDPNWATAAGQARIGFPGIRNAIAIQSGSYDLSAATLTFYGGATIGGAYQYGVTELIADTVKPDGSGEPVGLWLNNGLMLDGMLFMTALATGTLVGQANAGNVAVYVDNPADIPTNWHIRLQPMWSNEAGPMLGGSLLADPGDGYVYAWPGRQVPGVASNSGGYFYGLRWLRTDVKAGKLLNPQWWCGAGRSWSYSSQNADRVNSTLDAFRTQASFHKRADGQWQFTATNSNFLQYALRADLAGRFPALTNAYAIPNFGQGITYVGFAHPEQTWAGKSPNDVLVSYNPGFTDSSIHPEVYYPHLVQMAGI